MNNNARQQPQLREFSFIGKTDEYVINFTDNFGDNTIPVKILHRLFNEFDQRDLDVPKNVLDYVLDRLLMYIEYSERSQEYAKACVSILSHPFLRTSLRNDIECCDTLIIKTSLSDYYAGIFTYLISNGFGPRTDETWLRLTGEDWGPRYIMGLIHVGYPIPEHQKSKICLCILEHVEDHRKSISYFREIEEYFGHRMTQEHFSDDEHNYMHHYVFQCRRNAIFNH